MTAVRLTCHHCGDVWLTAPDITITRWAGGNSYRYACPDCDAVRVKSCRNGIADLLGAAGSRIVDLRSCAPIDADTLAAFTDAIENDDALAAAVDQLNTP